MKSGIKAGYLRHTWEGGLSCLDELKGLREMGRVDRHEAFQVGYHWSGDHYWRGVAAAPVHDSVADAVQMPMWQTVEDELKCVGECAYCGRLGIAISNSNAGLVATDGLDFHRHMALLLVVVAAE